MDYYDFWKGEPVTKQDQEAVQAQNTTPARRPVGRPRTGRNRSTQMTVLMTPELKDNIRRFSAIHNVSAADFLEYVVQQFFEEHPESLEDRSGGYFHEKIKKERGNAPNSF